MPSLLEVRTLLNAIPLHELHPGVWRDSKGREISISIMPDMDGYVKSINIDTYRPIWNARKPTTGSLEAVAALVTAAQHLDGVSDAYCCNGQPSQGCTVIFTRNDLEFEFVLQSCGEDGEWHDLETYPLADQTLARTTFKNYVNRKARPPYERLKIFKRWRGVTI